MQHKLLTLLIAIMASLGTMFAQSGTCGDNLTWNLTDSVLTISGTGAMADYTSSSKAPWFAYSNSINSVVIGDGVTSIGKWAFSNCNGMTSATIGNSVASIGDYAFFECSALTSTGIPNSVTTIGNSAFIRCTSLESVVIPGSVTRFGNYAFYQCNSLSSVVIIYGVTSIGTHAFDECSNLASVSLPNSITSIEEASFRNCSSLTSMTIPSNVISIGESAFQSCTSLTSVSIPNSVTSIGNSAFAGDWVLTSIELPNSLTSIGESAFGGCRVITSITNYATVPQVITASTFNNLNKYACTLYVPAESVEAYKAADVWKEFTNILPIGSESMPYIIASGTCGAEDDNLKWTLTSDSVLTISGTGEMADYESYTATLWYSNRESIKSIVIKEGVSIIGKHAFCSLNNLTSVTIPNSVTVIGNYAFGSNVINGCSNLTAVHISDLAAWCNIKFSASTSNPLYYAKNLYLNGTLVEELVIPDRITKINNYAFYNCSSLTSVTIPNSVTSIGNYAFFGCHSLTSVTIPNSITSIDNYAFSGCTNLAAVYISDLAAWCNINFSASTSNPLYYAKNLYLNGTLVEELVIPNGVSRINKCTFYNCSSLTSVAIPNSVTTIGSYAFSGCSGLTSVTIPNSVDSIGTNAFRECTGITSLTISNSVTTIESAAFWGCTGLTSITNLATTPQAVSTYVFGNPASNTAVDYSACTLYVPAESVEAYQTAEVWKEFTNILPIDSTEKFHYATLADIYNMAADSTFTLGAFDVVYVPDFQSGSNMYIKDSTGSCVIYKVNYGLQAGDHVEAGLQGKVSIYNGLHEVIPITAKEDLTITHGEAPAPIVATEAPSLNNASQYVVYEGVLFATDTAFVKGRRHAVPGTWNGQTITFYNQYYIGATLSANKTYNITAVNTIYRTTPQAYPLAVEEVSPAPCIIASGTCGAQGDNLTWTLTCDSVLTISGMGEMENYTSSMAIPWDSIRASIRLVEIGSSVTYILAGALSDCENLTAINVETDNSKYCSVDGVLFNKTKTLLKQYPSGRQGAYTIPNGVTNIGPLAFRWCTGLISVEFPNSVTRIGDHAFVGCTSLTSINIPNNVTSIGRQDFYYCSSLNSVEIPNSVTSIDEYAFQECNSLTSFTNYATNPQTINANVFVGTEISNCTLYVPAESIALYQAADVWKDFGNILPIEGSTPEPCITASGACGAEGDNLTWTLSCDSVLTISGTGKMADFSSSLEQSWYAYSEAIKSVIIGNGVTSIGRLAFYGFISLTSIEIPNSVTSIGEYAFGYCSMGSSCSMYSVTIPNSVTSIGNYAFFGCHSLTSVTIPNSVTSIGNCAFAFCSGLTAINVDTDNPKYTSIDGVLFNNNKKLLKQYPGGRQGTYTIPSSVTNIGTAAFAYSKSLTSIEIPNSVTSIGEYAFWETRGLTSVTIPNSVINIGEYAFANFRSLTSVTNYATAPQAIDANVFDNVDKSACTLNVPAQSLATYQSADVWKDFGNILAIEGSTPSHEIDRTGTCGDNMALTWTYDPGTKTLTISGNGTLNSNYTFGPEAPAEIEQLIIAEGVTSIGDSAFRNMSTLQTMQLPSSLKTIGAKAFENCIDLSSIYNYRERPCLVNATAFDGVNKFDCTLYVLEGSVDMYKSSISDWRDFYFILPISTTTVTEPVSDVIVEPHDNAATVTWPTQDNAVTYAIEISKDGVVFCRLTFNANGQLTGIAFAPGRDGSHNAPAALMTVNGLQFTITGLNSNTKYSYSITAKDDNDVPVTTYSGEFFTTGEGIATAVDNTTADSKATKLLLNGQILILRGEKEYTIMGQKVK